MWTSYDRAYFKMRLDVIEAKLDALIGVTITGGEAEMATIQELADAVAAQTTVIEAATTLLDGLSDQLAAAGVDPEKLEELKAGIEANTDILAKAVARNTRAKDELHDEGM